jgi:regulation of enolase protein 1 (concanavalin A-like superfamily)
LVTSNSKIRRSGLGLFIALAVVVGGTMVAVPAATPVQAGVFFNDTEFTYKEYWASHSTYTAGCGSNATAGGSWYIEPGGCAKAIELEIPDDVSGAIAAVIYVDLWRNRTSKSARFTINNGPQIVPAVGDNFSRTPFTATVPLSQLRSGTNVLNFQEATGPYHVHDVMVRVYYDASNPIVSTGDVTPPTGQLTSVGVPGQPALDPTVGGVLQVDNNQIVLTATATDAKYVEFHAYYDGFDEDNDGVSRDWHNFLRNNHGPGGVSQKPNGATIGHIGTDSTAPYSVTWNLPDVVDQSDVRFKIRVVDANGNVVEAPGGASAGFTLQRSYSVEAFTIPGFEDRPLYFDRMFPQIASDVIQLPTDYNGATRAYLLGNYWESPDISINDTPPFPAFVGGEDKWDTSFRQIDPSILRPGTNKIQWTYHPPGFGAMIERPGPMIVIHRATPTGPPVITRQPEDVFIRPGLAATFSASASGQGPLAYQWLRDGQPIPGANGATLTTGALVAGDNGSKYSVRVSNADANVLSAEATAYVTTTIDDAAPWWDDSLDFRAPLVVGPDAVARTDKVVGQQLNFSSLMASAGAGGPGFDPDSIRVVEVDATGVVMNDSVPYQFDPAANYNPDTNATGTLLWQLEGSTSPGQSRAYHVYFDKISKGLDPPSFADQLSVTPSTDEGFAALRFDLADDSAWYFHTTAGGGFSSIVDSAGRDWINWNSAAGSQGDFRGFPNAAKPPVKYFHPGRPGTTTTTVLHEGPLRITFESRANDNSWQAVWHMYPTHVDLEMRRTSTDYWVLYEGTPGGALDSGDFIRRSDGVQVPFNGTFDADLPGEEWMYAADPAAGGSFFLAQHEDDGSVDSYKQLDGRMAVLGLGRGGSSLNFPYLPRQTGGAPRVFSAGLLGTVDPTAARTDILGAYRAPMVTVGSSSFNGGDGVGPASDDFNSPTLAAVWRAEDPVGGTTFNMSGTTLDIGFPAGPVRDLWTGRNTAPRVVQDVANTDLDVAAAFTTVPTQQGQGQGMLFWQDAQNWLRTAIIYANGKVHVDVYRMEDGTARRIARRSLDGVPQRHLRVVRSGDNWTFQRSWNGSSWFPTGSFTIPLDVNQVGLYATTFASGSAPAFTASVDYFASAASPIPTIQGPKITGVVVDASARDATVSWQTDQPASGVLRHGPTVELASTTNGATDTTSHSISIDFLACGQRYYVRPQSATASGTTIGQIVEFVTDPCSPIVTDDFSSGQLGSHWTVFDPVGDAVVNLTNTNALVSLPAGSDHNLFVGANRAPRLRQAGPLGNFGVEAKFESVLTSRFQLQGIVVEESNDTFLRFEVHHDGSRVKAYVASVIAGTATVRHYGDLPASAEHYVRVQRSGDSWTMWHSVDAVIWSPVVTFDAAVASTYVGPYIGNTATGTASPPAFIGSIDYFFNVDTPIVDDGGLGPDVEPPVLSNVAAEVGTPSLAEATVTWSTDEPATTRVNWGQTAALERPPVIDNITSFSHSAVIGPLACGSEYFYQVQSTDAVGNVASSPSQSFTTATCPDGAFSDNFDSTALDPRWFVVDPRGTSTVTPLTGMLSMSVIGQQRHDLSTVNRSALRLLQSTPDQDFSVQVGFESVVTFASQIQGVVFEQSADTLVRFDLYSDGTTTRAFVGRLTPTSLQTLANVVVPGAVPGTLRVTRTGDNWVFEYSSNDGETWQTVHSGTVNLDLTRMGPFVGNANPQVSAVPAHTGFVDYFWSASDPIAITDPGTGDGPLYTIFGGDGLSWNGEPLEFGSVGLAQPDVNVQGRVADPDGIQSITYQVNGGQPVAMGLGSTACDVGISCTRRLANDGDFNADIDASTLSPGANTVRIRAIDGAFNVSTIDIPINYTPGTVWPKRYDVGWQGVTDIHEVSQPIDGRWVREDDKLHIEEIGYDRLIAVGDDEWGSFEVEVPVTINSFDSAGYQFPSSGPGIGFIPHWIGHSPSSTVQPKFGFADRLGALVWYRYRSDASAERFEIRDSKARLVAEDLTGKRLRRGTEYIFKMQAEQGTATQGPSYRLKVWEQGTPEPFNWDISTNLPVGAPDQGSLLLVAHHVDATFGNVQVRELSAVAPLVSPPSGTYEGLTMVTMTPSATGGEVRYTLDGTEPTATSTLYTQPLTVDSSTTVKAKTFRSGFEPSDTTERNYEILDVEFQRVTANLQAEYRFDEGSGTTVRNSVPGGSALNLTVQGGSTTTWLPDQQALRLGGSSLIRTALGARPLNDALRASGSFTVELWVDPATVTGGDQTLLHLAPSAPDQQNLAVRQSGQILKTDLRTSATNAMGQPTISTPSVFRQGLQQIVVVRRPAGALEVYVDGELRSTATRGGSLGDWGPGFAFGLGNTIQRNSPWNGDLYHVAIYRNDLSALDVARNFRAGVLPPSAIAPPPTDPGPIDPEPEPEPATLAPPTASPGAGTYFDPIEVVLESSVASSTIRYTLDGTDPTETSTAYTVPLAVSETTTVKARLFAPGAEPSAVAVFDYRFSDETRTTDGLLAFYPFNEPDGDVVRDESGSATPFDMVIADTSRTTRVPSGLRFDAATVAESSSAVALNSAIRGSGEFSVEMWLEPSDVNQLSAMVMGLSVNTNARHVAIVQQGTVLESYVRSTATNLLGSPPLSAANQTIAAPAHVVLTRAVNGTTTLFVNGAVVATGTDAGTLGSWANWPRLHIGGERDGSKPWLGTVYLLALYDRALSVDEVQRHQRIGDV